MILAARSLSHGPVALGIRGALVWCSAGLLGRLQGRVLLLAWGTRVLDPSLSSLFPLCWPLPPLSVPLLPLPPLLCSSCCPCCTQGFERGGEGAPALRLYSVHAVHAGARVVIYSPLNWNLTLTFVRRVYVDFLRPRGGLPAHRGGPGRMRCHGRWPRGAAESLARSRARCACCSAHRPRPPSHRRAGGGG